MDLVLPSKLEEVTGSGTAVDGTYSGGVTSKTICAY